MKTKAAEEPTEDLRQEALLVQQSKLASMGEMLSVIAHQWKQPLNSISLFFDNIDDMLETGSVNLPKRCTDS